MAREQDRRTTSGGVTQLVEAERVWQRSLDAERSRAEESVAAAELAARRRETAAADDIRRAAECRRRELDASLAVAVADVEREFAARMARYADASDAVVDACAQRIMTRAPWVAVVEDAS